MKFGYSYKTSDAARHEGVFVAKRKEDVFEALRAQGIRPMKVWEIRAWYQISKRTLTIAVLSVLLVASLFMLKRERGNTTQHETRNRQDNPSHAKPLPRKYIDGYVRGEDIDFADEGEKVLLSFAVPAVVLTKEEQSKLNDQLAVKRVEDAIVRPVILSPKDSNVNVELKRVLAGLKQEAQMIRATGRSTQEVLRYFADRQTMEAGHKERVLSQLRSGKLAREEVNELFRTMGFAPLSNGEKGE